MKKKAFIACRIMSAPAAQKCFSMFIVPFDCTTDLHLNDNCYLFPSLANKNLCLGVLLTWTSEKEAKSGRVCR